MIRGDTMDSYYMNMALSELIAKALSHNPNAMRALRIRKPALADDVLGPLRRRDYQECGKDRAYKD